MNFYRECPGGELILQTVGASPLAAQMPQQMKAYILHATLTAEGFTILGSDMTPESGLVKGNAVSIFLSCSSEEEIKNVFKALSIDGKVNHDIETTFWGALFGDLTDKFGTTWILHFNKKNQSG